MTTTKQHFKVKAGDQVEYRESIAQPFRLAFTVSKPEDFERISNYVCSNPNLMVRVIRPIHVYGWMGENSNENRFDLI